MVLRYWLKHFASEYGVTFNAKKTECICFSKNACPLQRQINVNGQRVKWKDKVKYLGIILTIDMCDDADIRAKRGEFIGSVNRLNAQFHVVTDQIRIRLLQTYCTAWYGCQTWLLNTTPVKGMNIEWKKAVRRTHNLPRTTRSKLVPLLAGTRSFQEQHERRWGALYVIIISCLQWLSATARIHPLFLQCRLGSVSLRNVCSSS